MCCLRQKKRGHAINEDMELKYYLLYRMFCVAETLLFPFGHFVITCVSKNSVCAYYQI